MSGNCLLLANRKAIELDRRKTSFMFCCGEFDPMYYDPAIARGLHVWVETSDGTYSSTTNPDTGMEKMELVTGLERTMRDVYKIDANTYWKYHEIVCSLQDKTGKAYFTLPSTCRMIRSKQL